MDKKHKHVVPTVVEIFVLCIILALILTIIGTTVSAAMVDKSESEETIVTFPDEPPVRYGFTDDEVYILAQLLCGDEHYHGDGEYDFIWDVEHNNLVNYEQISLVLNVVMNRVQSDKFPDNVYDVVTQKGQFAVMPKNLTKEPSTIALDWVKEWCDRYDSYSEEIPYLPEDHLYFKAGGNNTNVSSDSWR